MKRKRTSRSALLGWCIFLALAALASGWWVIYGRPLAKGHKPPSLTAMLGGKSVRLESAELMVLFGAHIHGEITNDGARQIRHDEVMIELLDSEGQVCQTALLFVEPRPALAAATSPDVQFINPGYRVSFDWHRGEDGVSQHWAGMALWTEAQRVGIHNNNAAALGMLRGAGASSIEQEQTQQTSWVDVSHCIRVRLKN